MAAAEWPEKSARAHSDVERAAVAHPGIDDRARRAHQLLAWDLELRAAENRLGAIHFQQPRRTHAEGLRELLDRAEGRVVLAGLEPREVTAPNAGLLGELLLRHPTPLSKRL